jgi:hypothetical protein
MIGYTPKTYSSGDTMQYRVAGYSMSIKWNKTEFKKWTEAQKRKAVFASRDLMRQWAAYIQEEARKRCPDYGGDLTNAIQTTGTTMIGGPTNRSTRVKAAVGIDPNWVSSFDADFQANNKEDPPWGVSSPELAVRIHNNWGSFVSPKDTPEAYYRAERKSNRTGRRVGELFLVRAYEEQMKELGEMAKEFYRAGFAGVNPVGFTMKEAGDLAINRPTGLEDSIPSGDYGNDSELPF